MGRFRPLCKIQAKRGGSSTVVAETIKPPAWWHATRVIQAFDAVLQDKMKKPSLFRLPAMVKDVRTHGRRHRATNSVLAHTRPNDRSVIQDQVQLPLQRR